MADIKKEHKHIPFKYGTITWTGAGYPSEEMMQVFNLMADLAIKKCEGEAVSTSEKDLRVCEVSNRASKPHCWGKMTWILEYESGKEPPHYVCSCEHGNRECLRLTRETALNKQNESTKI